MDEQLLDTQLEPIYNSSVETQDVVEKTGRKPWTIRDEWQERERERERELGKSMFVARHDGDENLETFSCYFIDLVGFVLRPS